MLRGPPEEAMPSDYVLTLDFGSSGLRAAIHLAERPSYMLASAERRYRVYRPRDADTLASRFADVELWQRTVGAIREALQAVPSTDRLSAVAVTAQRGGTAFLDASGAAIYLAPNTDLRAVFEGARIDEEMGAEVYGTTGHTPSLFLSFAKIAWWRAHHPRTAKRIATVTTLGGWAALRLTGVVATVPAELSEAGLLDVSTGNPAISLLGKLGVDAALLPPLRTDGAAVGSVSKAAAGATGLPVGAPVFLAGPDTHAAVLGAGASRPGDVVIVAGWSAPVQVVTAAPAFDIERRTWTGPHLAPGLAYVEASAGDTGGTLDMVRTLLGPRAKGDRLDTLLSKSRQSSNLVTAFWGPHAYNLSDSGISMGGLLLPVPITYNQVRPAHVARATLENIAYAIRECVELAAQVAGVHAPRSVALTGGMAASALFPQVLADVLNASVRRHGPRGSAVGAALAATTSQAELASASQALAKRGETFSPDVRGVLGYQEGYARWRRLRAKLDELADEL